MRTIEETSHGVILEGPETKKRRAIRVKKKEKKLFYALTGKIT